MHNRPMRLDPMHIESSTEHPGPVLHDAQSQPLAWTFVFVFSSNTVVQYLERHVFLGFRQLYFNALGLAMLDRIGQGLLGDAVEMCRNSAVINDHLVMLNRAVDVKHLLGAGCEVLQACSQAVTK